MQKAVLIAIVGLMVLWWNQPHFGHSFCVTKGLMSEADFVEELRPLMIRKTKERMTRIYKDGDLRAWPSDLALEDALDGINAAFDLMKECVAKRGIKYCRYAGPDKNGRVIQGRVITPGDPNNVSREDEYKYRYIVSDSYVEMEIIPWSSSSKNDLGIRDFKSKLKSGSTICKLGCSCSPNYDG